MIICNAIINSRPDSGSDENIIAADLAQSLNLPIDMSPEFQKAFKVANGKIVKALGRTTVNCSFAKEPTIELRCLLYVFQDLISPLIMGMAFLEETETLVKNRHRLDFRNVEQTQALQICGLDYPRRRLYCIVDSEPRLANADTGSEVDLMSLAYVQKRGFAVEQVSSLCPHVQFADGSTSQLFGKVDVVIKIGENQDSYYRRNFYILDGLTCDILLGEDFLQDIEAFDYYADAFALNDTDDDDHREVNAIVWFNMVESNISRVFHGKAFNASGKFRPLSSYKPESETLLMSRDEADMYAASVEEDSAMVRIKRRVDRFFSRKSHVEELDAMSSDGMIIRVPSERLEPLKTED